MSRIDDVINVAVTDSPPARWRRSSRATTTSPSAHECSVPPTIEDAAVLDDYLELLPALGYGRTNGAEGGSAMNTIELQELDLVEAWSKGDPTERVRFTFAISGETGAAARRLRQFVEPGAGTGPDGSSTTLRGHPPQEAADDERGSVER
jgi:hypothetical protein